MSDPQNPYGSSPDPYGQPQQPVPPAQPDPYGQVPQNPYGQQYGQYYGGYPQPGPMRRPGTVTAAAITPFVLSGLMTLVFGIAVVVVRSPATRSRGSSIGASPRSRAWRGSPGRASPPA